MVFLLWCSCVFVVVFFVVVWWVALSLESGKWCFLWWCFCGGVVVFLLRFIFTYSRWYYVVVVRDYWSAIIY